MTAVRVIDAGVVDALRSQALWHGIADAMSPGDAPVLSLCRPREAYVGIGYHRRLDEVDEGACRDLGLAVIRRRIGGGPVYLDDGQLFFQITMPAADAPAAVSRLFERALGPAVAAFRALGVEGARLDDLHDIVVGERKLSGTGAGRIGEGSTVVGNVIFRFPHERMAAVLALPDERMRAEVLRLMRRHVTTLEAEGLGEVGEADAGRALREAYADAFGGAVRSELRADERASVERWEARLADPGWLAGPDLPARRARAVKVRGDVWVVAGEAGGVRACASVVGGEIERAWVGGPALNGTAATVGRALAGARFDAPALRARLAQFGGDGDLVARALAPALELR